MPRRAEGHATALVLRAAPAAVLLLALGLGCAAEVKPRDVRIGHHHVQLIPPPKWEHLDHGRQQLFRNGEIELVLADWGPVTREGLLTELRQAEQLWQAGRGQDAAARVRGLHGPPVLLLPQEARADFWKPWTDATYAADPADSQNPAIGAAWRALIENAGALPEITPEELTAYVLSQAHDAGRREIAHTQQVQAHGRDWVVVETWDRVSHLYPRRTAWLQDRGYLLVLDTERGSIEQTGPAFQALLGSIEVLPGE